MFNIPKIEKARIIKGLAKKDLAEKAGISPGTYTQILAGENHYPPTIKKIADALALEMEDILVNEEEAGVTAKGA